MAGDDQDGQKSSFKVQDRRRFSASGDARDDSVDAAEAEAPRMEPAAAPPLDAPVLDDPASGARAAASYAAAGETPEITFATVVISFLTQALALLGEIPDPVDGSTEVDLEGARQFIDILGILEDKTRGNLDPHEAALLERALYDLRMKFVERSHGR
jgi:hypothetical protein